MAATILVLAVIPGRVVNAQLTPSVPGAACDSLENGICERWSVAPTALAFYAPRLAGRTVRIRGVMIAKCADQTLYLSAAAARLRQREIAVRLFSERPYILNAVDSLTTVEVEGILVGDYRNGTTKYAAALMNVVVIGTFGTIGPDTVTTEDTQAAVAHVIPVIEGARTPLEVAPPGSAPAARRRP